MSKGTPMVGVRMSPELRRKIEEFVARNQDRDRDGDLTLSKFIVKCVEERFAKMERSKKSAASRQRGPELVDQAVIVDHVQGGASP